MLGDPSTSQRFLPLHPLRPYLLVRESRPGEPRPSARRTVLADRLSPDGRPRILPEELALADFRGTRAHLRFRDPHRLLFSRSGGSPSRLHAGLFLLV